MKNGLFWIFQLISKTKGTVFKKKKLYNINNNNNLRGICRINLKFSWSSISNYWRILVGLEKRKGNLGCWNNR